MDLSLHPALARDALLGIAASHGLDGVRERLAPLLEPLADDIVVAERGLVASVEGIDGVAADAARHLVLAGGKRVRPVLCLLASRLFPPGAPPPSVVLLADVAELVHNATLLHDDVIDLGDMRRGRPTARVVYGNAASVLGGDLLLVQALGLVEAAGVPGLMPAILDVLRRMIAAESLQLEARGRVDLDVAHYLTVSEGKTASLFEWAVEAGARSSGGTARDIAALRTFGGEVGIAFQLLDDLLDLRDTGSVGKTVLQDVRGGTLTYPVLLALAEQPALGPRLVGGDLDPSLDADLHAALEDSGALLDTKREVARRTQRALHALADLPRGPARDALASVATALQERAR